MECGSFHFLPHGIGRYASSPRTYDPGISHGRLTKFFNLELICPRKVYGDSQLLRFLIFA